MQNIYSPSRFYLNILNDNYWNVDKILNVYNEEFNIHEFIQIYDVSSFLADFNEIFF